MEELEEVEEPRGQERIGNTFHCTSTYDFLTKIDETLAGFTSISSRGENEDACVSRKVRRGSDAARVGGYPRRAKRRDAFRLRIASSSAMRSWCARALRVSGSLPAPTRTVKRLSGEKKQTLGTHGTRVRRCSSVPGASRPDVDARQGLYPFRTAPRLSADARAAVWVTARPPPGLSSRRDVSRQKPTH